LLLDLTIGLWRPWLTLRTPGLILFDLPEFLLWVSTSPAKHLLDVLPKPFFRHLGLLCGLHLNPLSLQ
jgi:hypothetical protein